MTNALAYYFVTLKQKTFKTFEQNFHDKVIFIYNFNNLLTIL
jgi:hypothetical protein